MPPIFPYYRLWIPGPLPGMNEIISACAVVYNLKGGRRFSRYTELKNVWGARIAAEAKVQGFPAIRGGHFTYLFRERDRRRDPSNFAAGGVKLLEDGLQGAGLLAGDGWKNVDSLQPLWTVDAERPGVTLFVTASRQYRTQDSWESHEMACHNREYEPNVIPLGSKVDA